MSASGRGGGRGGGRGWVPRVAVAVAVLTIWIAVFWWPVVAEPAASVGDGRPSPLEDQGSELPAGVDRPRVDPTELRPAPAPLRTVDAKAGFLQLPDGTFLPTLNGVTSFDVLRWGGGRFPRVTGVIRNATDGVEWYVLENGDVLTTVNAAGTHGGVPVRRDLIVHLQKKAVLPARPK